VAKVAKRIVVKVREGKEQCSHKELWRGLEGRPEGYVARFQALLSCQMAEA
jgi:hypothetical protein